MVSRYRLLALLLSILPRAYAQDAPPAPSPSVVPQPTNPATHPVSLGFMEDKIATLESEIRRLTNMVERLDHQQTKSAMPASPSASLPAPVAAEKKASVIEPLPDLLPQESRTAGLGSLPNSGMAPGMALALPKGDDVADYNAIQEAIHQGDTSKATTRIAAFIKNYSTSPLLANVKYWGGEVAMALKNFEKSAQYYLSVYTDHPQHPKAPEALIKLAQTFKSMNKPKEAEATLDKLDGEYVYQSPTLKTMAQNMRQDLKADDDKVKEPGLVSPH